MSYWTWILIGIAWLVGSFILSLGIALLFNTEEDDRYLDEYFGEMHGEDIVRKLKEKEGE